MTAIAIEPQTSSAHSFRIGHMLEASRERGANPPPDNFVADLAEGAEKYFYETHRKRQAQAWAYAFDRLPVYLLPEERLVGMVYHLGEKPDVPHPMVWGEATHRRALEELPENSELVDLRLYSDGSFPGHITWRWDWMLEKGALQMRQEYLDGLAAAQHDVAAEFYRGVIIMLEAMLRWNDRHLQAMNDALDTADPEDRARLRELIDLCERVPAHPARTFHEAVQSFYFQFIAVMRENPYGGNGPGRLDYFLWPFLKRDLAEGRTTLEEARELIDELFIRMHERIQAADGWVETIVVGGTHPAGNSAVNPLSTIMVESIMDLDQTHPSVYVRIPDEAPDDFLDLATRYLLEGQNRAQILSDRSIVAAMKSYGMPEEDARMYTCGGCMEILPQGMNSDMLFTGTCNVPKTVELMLTGGKCLRTEKSLTAIDLPPLSAYSTFDELYEAFEKELSRELNVMFKRLDIGSEEMARNRPAYLISSMISDCYERGREMHDGGARYHDYGIAPLGIQNAGDALFAVNRAVFDDLLCTADELVDAMAANFDGHEALRRRLRALPKFGIQHPEADAMTDRVLATVCDICASYRNRWSGRIKPMVFTFVWAPPTGAALGATADGQYAGKPIAHGLTPQTAGMTDGITAAVLSSTGLCLDRIAGASTTMWDIDSQWADHQTAKSILKSFFQLGGHIFQGNTTDVSELIRATENPEDFPNLMVRVGGFSARFVTLGPELQDEIIQRYRHTG